MMDGDDYASSGPIRIIFLQVEISDTDFRSKHEEDEDRCKRDVENRSRSTHYSSSSKLSSQTLPVLKL